MESLSFPAKGSKSLVRENFAAGISGTGSWLVIS